MSSMIQIRNVPKPLHRKIKARAALLGKSMSDFLLEHIRQVMAKPSLDEVLQDIAKADPIETQTPVTHIIRAERDRE